jgi:hypothetical protein
MILFAYGDNSHNLHYRRFTWVTKGREARSHAARRMCGVSICAASQGSFFSGTGRPGARIFLTAGMPDHRIGTLYSDDNGVSWHDYASSRVRTAAFPWAVSGGPTPGPAGEVLGAVTDQSRNQVDFIRTGWR